MEASGKHLAAGTRVRVKVPGPVPAYSTWDDDKQRTSTPVKKRLQALFFAGDKKLSCEIVFIGSESERDRLKAKGLVKVQVREPSGSVIVITAEAELLQKA